jgi:hypothetical protein
MAGTRAAAAGRHNAAPLPFQTIEKDFQHF